MDNFIFRFLRFRAKAHNEDALTISDSYNYIIDHCDFSGGSDETLNLNYGYDFTVQWSTVTNSSSGQTYGFLMAYPPTTRISLHHNLMANHNKRFPVVHWNGTNPPDHSLIDYRNNVIYNYNICSAYWVHSDNYGVEIMFNIVGNYFKAGPNASSGCHDGLAPIRLDCGSVPYYVYSKDNFWIQNNGQPQPNDNLVYNVNGSKPNLSSPHDSMPPVTTYPVQENYDIVLNKAGAWPRDAMNIRTVNEVRTNTGQLRKDNDPLTQTGPAPPADTDMDGMPDCWENTMGFNPNDPSDNNGDHDNDGYTNIEEYINDMAFAQLGEMPHNCMLADGCPTDIESGSLDLDDSFKLSVSPNPYSAGDLHIKTGLKGTVHLFDVKGRQMYKSRISGPISIQKSRLNKRGLAPGIYIVSIQVNDGRAIQKPLIILQ
jgi:hypothetical protein